MSLRIATAALHDLAVAAMLRQQAALARTQNQIATGRRVQLPSDDPVAAAQLFELARTQSQLGQFHSNAGTARGRLQLEEQALADAGTLLQRVRELIVQANNATLSDADRRSILTELQSRGAQLQSIANRQDSNAEYLFAGYATTTQPFLRDTGGTMRYAGDAGLRQLQVGATQFVADSDPGADVFMDIPEGNGLFTTAALAGNAGSGLLDAGSIVDRSQWVADQYTITFSAADAWQVTDGAGNLLMSGSYQNGGAIAFRGVQVSISGVPTAGDRFTVQSAGSEAVFTTIDRAIAALAGGGGNDALRARLATALGGTLQQLDQAQERLLTVRAGVGARLSMLDDLDAARASQGTDLATTISGLQDLDYAAAIARMNQQYVSLQAAQQSYASIARLSLFNYL
ncbi:MAG: flagellar hook-associated protein FlgL [Gammaproteobacteria bacterium]|nr:flagellar hook-associated protein FlgL [Gammaproteobacteria bacterium]